MTSTIQTVDCKGIINATKSINPFLKSIVSIGIGQSFFKI